MEIANGGKNPRHLSVESRIMIVFAQMFAQKAEPLHRINGMHRFLKG
jgi:hypothetical protein